RWSRSNSPPRSAPCSTRASRPFAASSRPARTSIPASASARPAVRRAGDHWPMVAGPAKDAHAPARARIEPRLAGDERDVLVDPSPPSTARSSPWRRRTVHFLAVRLLRVSSARPARYRVAMTEIGPTLVTERLILRPPKHEDFDGFAEMAAEEETMRFIGGVAPRDAA